MELTQLKIMKSVFEWGSVTKSAAHLRLTPSVVSRQLAALEKECGGKLFYRNGRGLRVTELGQCILPKVDLILSTAADIAQRMLVSRREIVEDVRIGTTLDVGGVLTERLYSLLRKSHPHVRLHFVEGYSSNILSDLQERRVDVGVLLRDGSDAPRSDRIICDFYTHLVALPGAPMMHRSEIAFNELADVPLLMRSPPSLCRRALETAAAAKKINLSVVGNANAPRAADALLRAGIGYLVSPLPDADHMALSRMGVEISAGRLRAARIVRPRFARSLVVRTVSDPNANVQAVAKETVGILLDIKNASVGGS